MSKRERDPKNNRERAWKQRIDLAEIQRDRAYLDRAKLQEGINFHRKVLKTILQQTGTSTRYSLGLPTVMTIPPKCWDALWDLAHLFTVPDSSGNQNISPSLVEYIEIAVKSDASI